MLRAFNCTCYKADLANESVCGKVLCAFANLPDCLHPIFPGAKNNQAVVVMTDNPRLQTYFLVIDDHKKIPLEELRALEDNNTEVLFEKGKLFIKLFAKN